MDFDPTTVRVSKHFLLSDFLGCHSVYTKGYRNMLEPDDPELPLKMKNARALCEEFLEPFLEQAGPLSISYGYICPELSRAIVHYQDPDKPSHHRWDLGAACDIVSHEWVNHDPEDNTEKSAPIALAHAIYASDYPISRLITYAESPFLCVAVSAREVQNADARKAFYENRYTGGGKPDYRSYPNQGAKDRALALLEQEGLPRGWRGQGFPSYHGGGRRQAHHIRTSDYTVLSDFLFDLQSVANGAKNIPNVHDQTLMDMFYAAGDIYDKIIRETKINRFSIIGGFVNRTNPYFNPENDWQSGEGIMRLKVPDGESAEALRDKALLPFLFGAGSLQHMTVSDEDTVINVAFKI